MLFFSRNRPTGGWFRRIAHSLREGLRHPVVIPTVFCAGILLSLVSFAVIRESELTMAHERAAARWTRPQNS